MKRTPVPNTDIDVSPICLGTMTFGDPGENHDAIVVGAKRIEQLQDVIAEDV